jgi:hypothetical protein
LSVGTLLVCLIALAIIITALPLLLVSGAAEAQALLARNRKRVADQS